MTKVWFVNPASVTIRSILALPVKWGTSNLPPLIASTSGSVDQTKCLTPASLAARTAAVACLSSLVPASRKLVTINTPWAPLNAALRVSGGSSSVLTPLHSWLVMSKAMQAITRYALAGLEKSGLGDSDFRILEVLLHKGPLPVNVIGPKVNLTPGSISVAVDRLVAKGLVSRVECSKDRRVRMVALTPRGKSVIAPIFKEHVATMEKVFAALSSAELR